ncbi:hypothetical protein ACFE04_018742 [Oxalis oulophora]
MKRKRNLYHSNHPFDAYPFELLSSRSWKIVERIRVKDGAMTMFLVDDRLGTEEKGPFTNLRLRSRQATITDCTCFLRPGIDICVRKTLKSTETSANGTPEPVWLDARIISIERKPHETECSCTFYVKFYVSQDPFGLEKRRVSRDSEAVGLDQILILQKLEKHPTEDKHYRWNFAEDCVKVQKTKLFLGKFSADLSWLLVVSFLHRMEFDVRSVENKIVYQVLGSDDDNKESSCHLNAINFKFDENDITSSTLVKFMGSEIIDPSSASASHMHEDEKSPYTDVMDLRRSKRRNTQPERFFCSDGTLTHMDLSGTRIGGFCKVDKSKEEEEEEEDDDEEEETDDEMSIPLSCLFNVNEKSCHLENESNNLEIRSNRLASVNKSSEGESGPSPSKRNPKQKKKKKKISKKVEHKSHHAIVPRPAPTIDPIPLEQFHFPANGSKNFSQEIHQYFSKFKPSKHDHAENKFSEFEDMDLKSKRGRKPTNGRAQGGGFRAKPKRRDYYDNLNMAYRKSTLSAGAYSKLINSYMKDIDSTVHKEEPTIIDQWNNFKAGKFSEPANDDMDKSSVEDEGEMSETDMLWKEMEMALLSAYLLDEDEAANNIRLPNLPKFGQDCEHDYVLKEEIGMLCRLCGHVGTEIKYVSAPFMQSKVWTSERKVSEEEDSDSKLDEGEVFDVGGDKAPKQDATPSEQNNNTPASEEHDNVWALIPDLRPKLHLHQKKAFEFLWRNVAGSLEPALMENESKNTGGCCISHTPGAGKTFLMIAFLVSYLKLFPNKRPLVLAPKTTLYTWYKEFIKWKIPVPVHLIHGRRTYRVFKNNTVRFNGVPRPSQDVMHVIDCLEKLQKWHSQPSVLVMGYTSFQTLMREDSKFSHRRHMAKVLRESPGILVLDEGHNPRSTKSRMRKALMKVETDVRIMLSGTLFQNNFCEYFNTLCLSRPKFIYEVLKELDPKFESKNKKEEKARHLLESRARKLFLDTIARKIDSNENEERMQGLNMLKNITSGFIDVYETGNSDILPGLQIYTLFMNPTDIQHEILVKLHTVMATYHGYPLELELLITLASIHPTLIKTSNCVNKFFNAEELAELDKYKFDFKKGSKVMFVLNLIYRVVKKEKVLIFCHNIAPITMFVELLEKVFHWRKGREILVLTGDQELFERGRIMDKFEESRGPSKILFASITACAEGISLTAASRVILLDSEWNPSKTKQAIARAFRPGQQKVVYVYQLLARGTLEEGKYNRTTWKEWVSNMIFSEDFVEDPSCWQEEKIEDDTLREMVAEDRVKSFHMIMKNEKASMG